VGFGERNKPVAALAAFGMANLPPTGPRYDVHLLSERGGPVLSSGGMTLETKAFEDPAFDTVIVGLDHRDGNTPH
jgi:hypothetical protein